MSGDLRYAAVGIRNYHAYPVPTHVRRVWEVQYVRGAAIPSFLLGDSSRGGAYDVGVGAEVAGCEARGIWIFHPFTAHGWISRGSKVSEIAVVHLEDVAPAVKEVLAGRPWMVLRWYEDPFLNRAAKWLQEEAADFSEPVIEGAGEGTSGELRIGAVQQLIAAMVAYGCGEEVCPGSRGVGTGGMRKVGRDPAMQRVRRAEAWFEAHMHEGAGVAETARAVGTSVRHLSRVACERHGVSIGRVLHNRRMARAGWMLRASAQPVLEIAAACGYRNQSAFARAVHRYFGRPPRDVREEVERHREPVERLD